MRPDSVELGLRENAGQFALLVALTAFVGAMVGLERSALPLIGEREFGVDSALAVLLFIAAFGLTKSLTNLAAGSLAARIGRKRILMAGWLAAFPVPALIAWAPAWEWIIVANVFLGLNQGLAWSMAVVMKIDLVGPRRRGLALGLNEAAGYGGVALAAAAAGWLAATATPQHVLAIIGAAIAGTAFLLTILFVRDTAGHVALEQSLRPGGRSSQRSLRSAFARATFSVPALRSCSQAGLVNNLNDALAWGVLPLFLASTGASLKEIGLVAAIYPAVWGFGQIAAGHWSDRLGRKPLIVTGMLVQSVALGVLASANGSLGIPIVASVMLGVGTALVYPTLIAAVSDNVSPINRAATVGVYRFWRDMGYVVGAVIGGLAADALGFGFAIASVAVLTAISGLWVAFDLPSVAAEHRPSETPASL